jgi:2-acylglycerol O-acyltransferase 2
MKILGVDFAPLFIPNERRLQTLAVLLWVTLFVLTVPLSTALLYYWFFYTTYCWPLVLAYITWYFYDLDVCNKGGRR